MGMPKIEFRLQMFRGDWDQIWSQMRLLWCMEALVRINQTHLRQFDEFKRRGLVERSYPSVYRSGLHYETEKGTEIWPDIPSLLTGTMGRGVYPGVWGDCEDLSCYRTAELRELPWHYARLAPWNKKKTEHADPRFPQGANEKAAADRNQPWPGWHRVKGGIKAKPFAKWRRGPMGNYHYHALTLLPDGRLEDPSLVLGMGREGEFAEARMAEKLRNNDIVVTIQYAGIPDVTVVDPEKPSGYAGGKAGAYDAQILSMMKKGMKPEAMSKALGDVELGAYMSNSIPVDGDALDIDQIIGWDRSERRFSPKDVKTENRRLLGYANHQK